jgi:hypothetical protein
MESLKLRERAALFDNFLPRNLLHFDLPPNRVKFTEERNGGWQIPDEKSKNQTRDGLGIPGRIAEPTGTDGFPVLCHQFAPSSLSRRESCHTSSKSFWLKRNKLREALL